MLPLPLGPKPRNAETSAPVGSPPSMSRAGAGAWITPATSSAPVFSHVRQPYFGRRVTITRTRAGTLSSFSELSSPMTCSSPPQQGHTLSSGSINLSTLDGSPLPSFEKRGELHRR